MMEYANHGTLRDFLSKKNSMNLKERIRLATQISEGLSYLHNKLDISHQDLVNIKNYVLIYTFIDIFTLLLYQTAHEKYPCKK